MATREGIGWIHEDPTSGQMKEFWDQVSRKQIGRWHMEALIRGKVQPEYPAGVVETSGDRLGLARRILGDDFIGLDEMMKMGKLGKYPAGAACFYAEVLPAEEELVSLRNGGYVLCPLPRKPANLLDVRKAHRDCFYLKTGGWYVEREHEFSRHDLVQAGPGWIALLKEPVPGSLGLSWDRQRALVPDGGPNFIPNAAEVAWVTVTVFRVRGIRLFEHVCVRTSSADSDGYPVHVGNFGSVGL